MNRIKFGTSGWRGVIAEDLTFEAFRLAVGAVPLLYAEARHESRPMELKEVFTDWVTAEDAPRSGEGGSGRVL